MVSYDKPFLNLQSQVQHLSSKGLECGDVDAAMKTLHDIGYYRLTAYTYPMRRLLLADEKRDTEHQFRADEYVAGARLADGVALAEFDSKLRGFAFDGLTHLELALRFQLAHTLGRRNARAHVTRDDLDEQACAKPAPQRYRAKFADMYEYWCDTYDSLVKRASGEDFIRHFDAKYSGDLPVWIAVEVFDFGALTRLYGLLKRSDQNEIARRFGVTDGRQLHGWLQGLNLIRNHAAHHNRLWNRNLTHRLAVIPSGVLLRPELLAHVGAVQDRDKVYPHLAVLSYTLGTYDSSLNWHRTLRTQLRKFPGSDLLDQTQGMGLTVAWDQEELWTRVPAPSASLPTPTNLKPLKPKRVA